MLVTSKPPVVSRNSLPVAAASLTPSKKSSSFLSAGTSLESPLHRPARVSPRQASDLLGDTVGARWRWNTPAEPLACASGLCGRHGCVQMYSMSGDYPLFAQASEATPRVLSVSQLSLLIEGTLESAFHSLWVSGEVSEVSRPRS